VEEGGWGAGRVKGGVLRGVPRLSQCSGPACQQQPQGQHLLQLGREDSGSEQGLLPCRGA